MRLQPSRAGLLLAGAYLAAVFGTIAYAMLCKGMYCGIIALWCAFPWQFVLEGRLSVEVGYPLAVAVNAVILYVVGWGLGKLGSRNA